MANDAAGLAQKLAVLRSSYAAKLPDKLKKIEEAYAPLSSEPSPEKTRHALDALHRQSHKLAGSGETFGFKNLSDIARQIEDVCASLLKMDDLPSSRQCQELGKLMKILRTAVSGAPDVPPAAKEAVEDGGGKSGEGREKKTVLCAVEDSALEAKLKMELSNFGFQVRTLSHYAELGDKLKELRPAALVLDLDTGENGRSGEKAVECLEEGGALDCPVVFLSTSDDIKSLLAAVRAGVSAYLTKPVSTTELVDVLDDMVESDDREPYRILIVDDDQGIAVYNNTILQDAGMNVLVVTDPMKVMERMGDFAPELILMDLYMPGCNGKELASAIRLRPAFASIPIVFLSGETDRDKQLAAMGRGGDDFLTKTIHPEHLVASVKTRVQRFRMLRSLMTRDGMTGLFNHTTTNELLETELARSSRSKTTLALAALDIDHFKGVNDTYGHAVGDQVIKGLAKLLKQRLRGTDIIGRMGGEEFAAVLPGAGVGQARKMMDQVRLAFSEIQYRTEMGTFTVTLSCGIAEFPRFTTAPLLIEAADRALYAAKEGGRDQTVLAEM